MRRRRRRRRLDPIRSIGLLGGFDSIADGFATLGEGMGGLMGVDVEDPGNGRWVFKRKPPHPCVLPDITDASWGDVWQCGECGTQWTVTNDEHGKLKMERTPAPPAWYPSHGHTTGTTYTYGAPYWWSSETWTKGTPPSPEAGDSENP